jgi:hypothetical protein
MCKLIQTQYKGNLGQHVNITGNLQCQFHSADQSAKPAGDAANMHRANTMLPTQLSNSFSVSTAKVI